MIGTTAAIIGSAIIGAGATALASSNSSKAAQTAADAQSAAAQQQIAEQQREFDLIQQQNAPYRQIGTTALGALGSQFGLPGYSGGGVSMTGAGAPSNPSNYGYQITLPSTSMTGTAPTAHTSGPEPIATVAPAKVGASTQVPMQGPMNGPGNSSGGVNPEIPAGGKTAPTDPTMGHQTNVDYVPGGSPSETGTPAAPTPPSAPAAPAAQVPDWNTFLQQNPDIAAWAAAGHGDPNAPPGSQTPQQAAAYWVSQHQRLGDDSRAGNLPMMNDPNAPAAGSDSGGPTTAPGYTDPTTTDSYTVGSRPDTGPAPTPYVSPDRPMTGPAPTRPDIGTAPAAPTYGTAPTRSASTPLDISLGAYQQSPGYQFQVSEAMKQLGNTASASGGVFSGQRLKAIASRTNDLANQDYGQWRDYTTGQYNTDRSMTDSEYGVDLGQYNTGRGMTDSEYQTQLGQHNIDAARTDQNFGIDLNQYDQQQNRGDLIYNTDRAFGYGQTQDALAQYNLNRNISNGLYQDDRAYDASRYDTRNSQLMSLAGLGSNATANNASAAQSFANNVGSSLMTGATAQGNAAINSANAWTSGVNNLMTTGAYLGGRYLTANPGTIGGSGAPVDPYSVGVI